MRVYLVGFMAVGKTTLGRKLAKKLGISFMDIDSLVCQKAAKTIDQIFVEEGEAAFRQLEAECLREAGTTEKVLISTGGGAPMHRGNMDFMLRSGLVVWLKMDAAMIFTRLEKGRVERPLIKDMDDAELLEYIHKTLEIRALTYKKAQIHHSAMANSAAGIDQLATTIARYSR